ncbi:MAG: hypothetical protein ABWZ25_08165 [Chitinophagaceae bacterium]
MNRSILAGLFLLFSGNIFSQNIEANIAIYAEKFPQEKAYIHYDKSTYTPGETIWFKVYLMEGINAANASKNFYIDWTDEAGNLVYRTTSPLVNAMSGGQFDIPSTYTGRFLHVKGYTKWMLNFDTAFIYRKDIRILGNTTSSNQFKNTVSPTLQFFPEGGDAVAGLVNKIAFKSNDQWGRPVKFTGVVVNDAGKVIDSLRPLHNGMGFVFINPKAGERFTAKWKDDKGNAFVTALPEVKPSGVTLQVSSASDKRFFLVNASPNSTLKTLHVIGTMNQYQVFSVTRDAAAGEVKGVIPIKQLPSGILTITVFDEAYKPLAERILFINNEEYSFRPEMTVEHWGLNKRARNDLQIVVPDSLVSNLSISVTDAGIDSDSSHTIISDFLLSADLRGQVYDPAFYFRNNSDTIARKLDLVMLTHGWRRFNWEDVVRGKYPEIRYPRDTSYLTLSGRVFGALPSQIKESGAIILLIKQKGQEENNIRLLPLNADGTFRDPQTILFDSATIYHQLQKSKGGSEVAVNFFEDKLSPFRTNDLAKGTYFIPSDDTTGYGRHTRLADETAKLLKRYEGELLANVIVKSKAKTPLQLMDEKYASGLFSGGDSYNFDLVNDPFAGSAMNVFTYLQGKVAGLQISNPNSQDPTLSWRGGSPSLYLNEVQSDAGMISSMSVNDIAYIKVFRPPFMGGFGGAGGAIAIYTKRGGDQKPEPGKGLSNSKVTGYNAIRVFYSPNYGTYQQENERPDIRTTLYWNPAIETAPGQNKVKLSFYNNDITKSFRIVIEGMTTDGRLTHLEEIME